MSHVLVLNPSARPACAGADLHLFFGLEVETWDQRLRREAAAKAICNTCPIRTDCLESHDDERFGIWGGETEDERRLRHRRERRQVRAA